LTGAPQPFVGPQDVALAIIRAVYESGYVKNKVMEFVGPGVGSMTADYRNGVDVMTTETTCLSSVWRTDDEVRAFLDKHHRAQDYRRLDPADVAYYDGCVEVDLSAIRPMIALPFHPSNAYTIDELYENLEDILHETEIAADRVAEGRAKLTLLDKVDADGRLHAQQGVIAGCAGGTYTNIVEAAHALRGARIGNDEFYLSVYPSSQPVFVDLDRKGLLTDLMDAGAIVRTAFCGPCFGAGDTPANNTLSVRHATRNFPNREGSKPGSGQMAGVALMDARSIAATALAGGRITSAEELDCWGDIPEYEFDDRSYRSRVFNGFGAADPAHALRYGPNIKDWPQLERLADDILLVVASKILDPVTTTDELIPSGETSSLRSNPLGLAEFTLSRRDPGYVERAKAVRSIEEARLAGKPEDELAGAFEAIRSIPGYADLDAGSVEVGSVVYARRPGDGSAREQAASCQRVLGGLANITSEYATKRYRSNCINWGMVPFQMKDEPDAFEVGDCVFVPGIRAALDGDLGHIDAYAISGGRVEKLDLYIADMTPEERAIVKAGCLINFNRSR
ncbi:MAG: hydratase, partial [Coriobacteriales bacterium]